MLSGGYDEMNFLRRATLGDALRRAALRYPDKRALSFHYADGRTVDYTFDGLNRAVNRVANALTGLGIGKGDRVAVFSHNSPEVVLLAYALLKTGAWYVPVNFMLRGEDVRTLVNFAEARMLFVEDGLAEVVRPVMTSLPTVEKFGWLSLGGTSAPPDWLGFEELTRASEAEPEVLIDDEDVATLFFTSGTEAAPKGVLSTHRNFLFSHLAYTINLGLTPQDVWLVSLPLIHMAGFNLMLMAHVFGQTVVMTQLPVPAQMLRLMAEYRVTMTALPPTLYVALLKEVPADLVLPEARILMTWASTIPQAMVDGWNRLAPNARFFTLQGSSESTATALTGSFFKSWAEVPRGDGRWVGKAMAFGSELRLVDDEDREVAPGEPGEQVIRGPVVMKGYYRNEEETRRVFRGGWFHTGDVLFCDEAGNYYFADRKKDMIKTGGENVFSQEVENVIGAHPGVLQCAVFGIPDPRWGEAVTAAVVPRPGVTLTEQEILGFCRERLPGYKVPKYVIVTETLPTSAAGKLLKRALREIYANLAAERKRDAGN